MSRPPVYLYTPRNTSPGYVYFDWDTALKAMLGEYGYDSVEDLIGSLYEDDVYVDFRPGEYLIIDDSGGQIEEVEVRG